MIQYASTQGDAEIIYVDDVNEDNLTFDLKRRIERDTKEEEIEKSRRAIERRKERGYDHGRPRFGMTYDADGHYQIPGKDFDAVLKIFRLDNDGKSRQEISNRLDIPTATVQNVLTRREWYREREKSLREGLSRALHCSTVGCPDTAVKSIREPISYRNLYLANCRLRCHLVLFECNFLHYHSQPEQPLSFLRRVRHRTHAPPQRYVHTQAAARLCEMLRSP